MKKYLVLSIVFAAICLGLSSCVINVDRDPPTTGKIKVYFELARDYEPGWISIEEIRVVNDETRKEDFWDERIWEGYGKSFYVEPGYYYVEIDAYSRWERKEYTVITRRPKYIKAGQTVKVVFDGDRVFFD